MRASLEQRHETLQDTWGNFKYVSIYKKKKNGGYSQKRGEEEVEASNIVTRV